MTSIQDKRIRFFNVQGIAVDYDNITEQFDVYTVDYYRMYPNERITIEQMWTDVLEKIPGRLFVSRMRCTVGLYVPQDYPDPHTGMFKYLSKSFSLDIPNALKVAGDIVIR